MTRTRYTLHVPLALNDGTSTPAEVLSTVENELLDIGGGFTSTLSTGAWRGEDGTIYREPVRQYAVDAPATPHTENALRNLADTVAIALDQEAVYLTRAALDVELVAPVFPFQVSSAA